MKKINKVLAVIFSLALIIAAIPANVVTAASATEYKRVQVHDPSIVVGYYEGDAYTSASKVYGTQNETNTRKKIYFVFGSHKSFAYSEDLCNWTKFTNNLSTSASTIFAEDIKWASTGRKIANAWGIEGSLWAPDVIWNPEYENADGSKGAWMMYMSIAGINRNSVITLLTSDSLNGKWTRQGAIVYSGFDGATYDYKKTDYQAVTGDTGLNSRYVKKNGETADIAATAKFAESRSNRKYCAHAIDACVLFDNGKLWMSYGSWDGGIYMIELDKKTGLRDLTHTYEYKYNVSDPYMGLKLAGGEFNNCGGEASYIKKIGNKYYLFISYEGLESASGYNMRSWSSDSITGPYKDLSGDDARFADPTKAPPAGSYTRATSYWFGGVGTKLMSYYKWGFMDYGFVAQGHNSVLTDTDGKNYVLYHTRFTDKAEYFEMRVHQIFKAPNGALVAAPFEYSGETLSKTAYAKEKVAGTYQILSMVKVESPEKECVEEKTMTLTLDGKVTGEYTGTWTMDPNGPYVTIKAKGTVANQTADEYTYQGVFLEQKKETTNDQVMTLSVAGNNDVSVWGYKTKDADPLPAATNPPATNTDVQNQTTTTKTLKKATITVKQGKKKVSKVTVKKNKKVTLKVSVNSKGKLSMKSLTKKQKKILSATYKKGKLTLKGKKKGTVKVKISAKKTSKYKAATKTITVKVK
ncbi:MAG: glycoside hydrolase family 43 protein [Eubacterium sp.]|nr:glycoside hydrolase family 43 protein [Eubacterium sp.]